ncbi:hypothetical protein SCOCK_290035 [Actinacidiphila cocklensis]|uniref:Transposase n=1 Tax=Actinacidiphila cocklensis TaxID=887465 RepID=A0A9W4GRS8_9ACTN|nr:hypothetical protein SCOCK_290035 [Actinacidiphila cocklensis]
MVLRHENAVLRRQVPRVRYEPADRLWFATLSHLIPRHRWTQVFPMTPATLPAWHRKLVAKKWDYSQRRRPGRPPTASAIKALILRMAAENPGWGHQRIHGELTSLGHKLAASTVWNILNQPGAGPRPASQRTNLEAVPPSPGRAHRRGRPSADSSTSTRSPADITTNPQPTGRFLYLSPTGSGSPPARPVCTASC